MTRHSDQLVLDLCEAHCVYRDPIGQPLPPSATPAARLERSGAASLIDSELLLALFEPSGTPTTADHLQEVEESIDRLGGLQGLLQASMLSLTSEFGRASAVRLRAAIDLARRLARKNLDQRDLLEHPVAVAEYLQLRYTNPCQEVMGALFLDIRHRLVHECELFRGKLGGMAAEPRPVLKKAIEHNAAVIILFHTHPSGDPGPSKEDLSFTRRMDRAAKDLGIKLLDHLIIGGNGHWVSLRRRGGWSKTEPAAP